MTCGQILISFPKDQLLSIKGHLNMRSKGLHCQARAEGREGRLYTSLPGNMKTKEQVRNVNAYGTSSRSGSRREVNEAVEGCASQT